MARNKKDDGRRHGQMAGREADRQTDEWRVSEVELHSNRKSEQVVVSGYHRTN